eukprot:c19643_g1_i1.p1 GENE.c19643_g1_i1~~c19643_g1_i1.p1  ORF type:complete len:544 (+),score=110.83 c19643_g1_i1:34-1632(+)
MSTANLTPHQHGYELRWSNIEFTIKVKKRNKVILNNVSGLLPAGTVTCILGPSGAGKTSLLNALSGRIQNDHDCHVSGSLELNRKHIKFSKMKRRTAYVLQENALFATLTPRECLRFSAALRLPDTISAAQKEALVNEMIVDLGLTGCADTRVGNALITGLSGGEKKRTSVGVELVTNPHLVFLDEPTSGLDSFSAFQCVDLLRRVASRGSSVMCTIHQPASDVFAMFDYAILMKDGIIVYHGAVSEMGDHFTKCGYALPEAHNPSDHVMTVVNTCTLDELKERNVIKELWGGNSKDGALVREASGEGKDLDQIEMGKMKYPVSFRTQLYWLMWREVVNFRRDVGMLIARYGLTAFLATLFGIVFYGAGNRDDTVGENFGTHFGVIMMMTMNAQFGSVQPTLLTFPIQRPIFLREYATGTYRSGAYFLSKALTEVVMSLFQIVLLVLIVYFMADLKGNFFLLVIVLWLFGLAASGVALTIGSAANDPLVAVETAPAVLLPQVMFAGFFVRTEHIPNFLRWAQVTNLFAIKMA